MAERTAEPIVAVGWSLGGYLAREAARDRPEWFRKVITLGSPVVGGPKFTAAAAWYRERGFDVEKTDRGGDVTLHAPGQLVAYPIIDLRSRRDVRWYVRILTETMRRLVAPFEIDGGEMPGMVGLWVDTRTRGHWPGHDAARQPAKVGAIGVRLSRWITMHGFALNLSTDLSSFEWIVPCGISAYRVTSVRALCGAAPPPRDVAADAHAILAELLDLEPRPLDDAAARSLDDV